MREYSASVGRETPPDLSFRGRLNFSGGSGTNARAPLSGTTETSLQMSSNSRYWGEPHQHGGGRDSYSDRCRAIDRFMNEVTPMVEGV